MRREHGILHAELLVDEEEIASGITKQQALGARISTYKFIGIGSPDVTYLLPASLEFTTHPSEDFEQAPVGECRNYRRPEQSWVLHDLP